MPFRRAPRPSKRSPQIVTVCVLGSPATKSKHNRKRERCIKAVIASVVKQKWGAIDAVLLPAGFFYLERRVTKLDFRRRVAQLSKESFGRAICKASKRLSKRHPGAVLVLGVDSSRKDPGRPNDQLCIGLRAGQIVAIAPKIFPTNADTTNGNSPVIPNVEDYGSDKRFVDLPSGHRALLCTCYDTFGVAESSNGRGIRAKYIRWLYRAKSGAHRVKAREEVTDCLRAWGDSLKRNRPSVVLSAIHQFAAPGRDGYWQRHGIATASSATSGSLCAGAAHFKRALPDSRSSILSANGVSRTYLALGNRRKYTHTVNIVKACVRKNPQWLIRVLLQK